jgi:hypothetical protein
LALIFLTEAAERRNSNTPGEGDKTWSQHWQLALGCARRFPFTEEKPVQRNRPRPEGCQSERPHPQSDCQPVTLNIERVLKDFFVPPQGHRHFTREKQSDHPRKKSENQQRASAQFERPGNVDEISGKMGDVDEFVNVFEPASPKLGIAVAMNTTPMPIRRSSSVNGLNFSINCIACPRNGGKITANNVARQF